MGLVAQRKNLPLDDLLEKMQGDGPEYKGTQMEAVRLYDDKRTFTGVHAHGGPSTVDRKGKGTFGEYAPNEPTGGTRVTLADLCDRSTPDIRGVNKNLQS